MVQYLKILVNNKYYQMKHEEFKAVIDKWANKDLFEMVNGKWIPKFQIE